jgi:hypothetical protein
VGETCAFLQKHPLVCLDVSFQGIWCSVLHHIVNEHEWILSHSDDGIHQCLHGPLENQNKPWLHRKQHAHVLKDLAGVVMDKRLLNKVAYYLNFRYVLIQYNERKKWMS